MMDEEHEDDKKHYSLKKLVQDEPSKKRKKKKRETDEPKCESFQVKCVINLNKYSDILFTGKLQGLHSVFLRRF